MPASNPTFTEKQNFRQPWLWILFTVITLGSLYPLKNSDVRENVNGLTAILSSSLLMGFIIWLFLKLALHTRIDSEGIHYRFSIFHRKERSIFWDQIQSVSVVTYNPLLDYGGWGIRTGLLGKGRAYNVSGDQGIFITYNENQKVMIGTKRPKEVKEVLKALGKLSD